MAISFVSTGVTSRAPNGNVTLTLPPGWQVDDIFICVIASRDNANSTMPPGWIAIDAGTNNGVGLRTTTFYKIAVSDDTDPTVTHISGSFIEATIVAYRGIHTTDPLDVIGMVRVNPSSTTVTATSITTLRDNTWVIFTGSITSRSTFSTYSGIPIPTERLDTPDRNNYPSTFLADFIVGSAGSTDNRTCTATTVGVNNGLMFALRPTTNATITFITDPSNANIYIDGILQPVNTSTSIVILTGTYTITLYKAGYLPYTEIITLIADQFAKVATILIQTANITDKGIVICPGSNISTCPISPISCPILTTPLDSVNLIVIIISTALLGVTIRFIYTLDGVSNYADVPVNLAVGNNIIYAFPLNVQYPPDTVLSLDDVILI